jgi:hypothetical protein
MKTIFRRPCLATHRRKPKASITEFTEGMEKNLKEKR